MHVISKRPFNDAVKGYPNQKQALEDLYRVLIKSAFGSPETMRRVFLSLDNYVKHIVSHAGYDKLCKRCAKGELS